MQPRAYFIQKAIDGNRTFLLPMAISIMCHLIFFSVVIFAPRHLSGRKFSPTAVHVSLVTLPSAAGPVSTEHAFRGTESQIPKPEKVPARQALPRANADHRTKPSDAVSVAPKKWTAKTSLKEKTFKPSKVVEKAIKRIEEKAEESRPSPVAEAIDRLRVKVGGKEALDRLKQTGEPGGVQKGFGIPAGRGTGGKIAPEELIYRQQIAYYIRNNWVYPDQLGGQQPDLESRLMIKIISSGEIKDIWFEKRSGNRYLDDSAYKAVKKSNPLPALPKGYQSYTIGLQFTPSGLQ